MTVTTPPGVRQLILASDHLPDVFCQTLLRELPDQRMVFAARWNNEPVIAKLYFGRRAKHHWHREKTGCIRLQQARISTPELIYSGQTRDGEYLLLFRQLTNPTTLLQRWQQAGSDSEQQNLLAMLYRLTGQMHQRGLLQTDAHLGNYLIEDEALYAIDGDGVRRQSAPLSEKVCYRNLALLLAQFPIAREELLLATLPSYQQELPHLSAGFSDNLKRELNRARRLRRTKYVAKCTRNCSEFVREQNFQRLALFRRELSGSAALKRFLSNPDEFMELGTLLKDGNSATVVRVTTEQGDWVVKRYNQKSPLHALKKNLKTSRALVSWRNAHRLTISGIATPQALAVVENRVGLWKRTCYYVSRWCDAPDVRRALEDIRQPQENPAAAAIAALFHQLHTLGIYHGDCKATNFLLKDQTVPVVVDLDAMGERRCHPRYLRRYRKDRQRFLENWPKDSLLQRFFDQQLP